ncbi:HTH-type transcriptional regulator/antitoxin HigA [Rhizobium sp. SG_E_25_P2]|uniref:helix-turn-helix domain-containing protein n=1 Tax=Rhizobium sp. SG_E_25_P2 TaxID=2879942 RepID=UPI0024747CCA|nr:transcriptional regulator [Rhizobium sp. SG_E_25_P2]MDH6265401.1 HTH-type transcriptional regulator/antitoxin HigA [Rhizobium sp. SG_E_25_P2]
MIGDLKPIRTEADHDAALGEVERLWGAKSGTPEGDRLDVLATLIEVYEAKQYPMDPPDPIEAIKFRMEQQGLTRKDLEPIFGTRNRTSEILNRRRGLSIEMIRQLHAKLGISAEVLIRHSLHDKAA